MKKDNKMIQLERGMFLGAALISCIAVFINIFGMVMLGFSNIFGVLFFMHFFLTVVSLILGGCCLICAIPQNNEGEING